MAGASPLQNSATSRAQLIRTVEMHTTGEPTRIIYSGFPKLQGTTLLQKRADAKLNHDHVRGRLMLEPRGHREMYGALLVNTTELTTKNEADIGVLFMHNEGWATMCGHATIALGRFLIDYDAQTCPDLFTDRKLHLDEKTMTTAIKLHCPCGILDVTVPVTAEPQGRLKSDPERQVSFVNVDSFATGINVEVSLPTSYRWPELGERAKITADFCYGGAFYCVVGVRELGFPEGLKASSLDALSQATGTLKAALVADPQYKRLFEHSNEEDLGFLYGVIITDEQQGNSAEGAAGAETGLCFFAAQQVDRSPCGSGVAARRALAHAKGLRPPEKRWTYHSLVSNAHRGQGAFTAHVVGEPIPRDGCDATEDRVRVQVEGRAFYTGFASFFVEQADSISSAGFAL